MEIFFHPAAIRIVLHLHKPVKWFFKTFSSQDADQKMGKVETLVSTIFVKPKVSRISSSLGSAACVWRIRPFVK